MITLKEALKLNESKLTDIKKEILESAQKSELNAYVGDIQSSMPNKVPILIKDNINVKGWEITCASNILKDYIAPYNASVIEKMHNHSLCGFGRANMDEFAMGSTTESSIYGITKNPRNLSHVPGGSSGGSAAAVAGGIAIAALGSDTGGSIRQPAAYCGCVGLKPTYGSVSRYGLIAYSSSLDQIGPITQNVEDCAILFDIIKGHDPKDSTSANIIQEPCFSKLNPQRKLKIAILKDLVENASDTIKNAYFETIEILKKMGHTIVEKTMKHTEYHIATYYIICAAEASSNLARFDGVRYGNRCKNPQNLKDLYLQTRTQGFGEEVKNRILLGSFVLSSGYYDAYYLKAQKIREMIKEEYHAIFMDCDSIFIPVAPDVAPKFGSTSSPLEMYLSDIYTIGVNLAGLPALSLPVGIAQDNLPIGMQFIGKAFDEQSILDIAYGLEQELQLKF
ncbi:Asp-tRNA(Asn)/Glu-tRNA(Gln) amidotransferase subunit GatA [Helicobacter anatolicus]|uniref:Asp-tRNA(Asn)/Glu-tRNA(Gln) amidotransferase subunit GatA n=1 Tax=Helicobacter anatolicus TaxID=2905874 RepID=UPI001E3E08F7|nr:Asp-tRNA(Asn)/Glu-tRNA(Gln) amidotransferase subunit GatA [Helicobacter anatolicus]MCE3039430.1 Asp-tRNA(Asn)/Glu-tRNA(Gln) amidotransferase subunit GatA [Helicobacter anatolicus]